MIGLLQLVLLVVGGSSVAAWLNLAPLVSGPLLAYASFGPPQRRYLEKFRRSIEANRRLVDGPST